jgi:CheY-like chemotaxis protein
MMSEPGSGTKTSVLLVEDEPIICELASEALQEQGFDVRTASNANEALDYITAGSAIDVLFTDINLGGGMDGAMLARVARQLRPGLAVIYTSGRRSSMEDLSPIDDAVFLPKPYNPFDVGRVLENVVARSRSGSRARSSVR